MGEKATCIFLPPLPAATTTLEDDQPTTPASTSAALIDGQWYRDLDATLRRHIGYGSSSRSASLIPREDYGRPGLAGMAAAREKARRVDEYAACRSPPVIAMLPARIQWPAAGSVSGHPRRVMANASC